MTEDRWADARRLEGWAGEVRVNLIRAAALVVFYAHHLMNAFVWGDDPSVRGRYHVARHVGGNDAAAARGGERRRGATCAARGHTGRITRRRRDELGRRAAAGRSQ